MLKKAKVVVDIKNSKKKESVKLLKHIDKYSSREISILQDFKLSVNLDFLLCFILGKKNLDLLLRVSTSENVKGI